ncbi:class I adenylate-forming enzyme family protein [Aeribacillus pallidus]|nr:class I adenylate-forming enzyme family protein [Aeribacillus pallidus]
MAANRMTENVLIHELIEESAKKFKDRVAFAEGDNFYTFEDMNQSSLRLARHFIQLGLKKGDAISAQLPNCWEFVVVHLAASRIGLVFNPLSPNYRKKELQYMLSHCEAKAFVTIDNWKGFNHEQLAHELKAQLPHLQHVLVAGEKKNECSISITALLESEPDSVSDQDIHENLPAFDDPCIILFTSGTESNPKGVLHTFRTFVPCHLLNGKEYQITDNDTILCLTPLCHMFSLPMIIISLRYGAKHLLYREYKSNEIIDLLKKEQVSFLTAAPAHLIDLLRQCEQQNVSGLNPRLILTGGTKIPAKMVQDLRATLNCDVAAQWGMSEICAGTFTRPGDEASLTWETVGRPAPVGEVIIVDERHKPLPTGEIGEIAFKGESLFIEYYKNPQVTAQSFTEDGYFLTGDQGWLDEKGYLHFVGRTKDTINRGGLKYHASEIEEALQMHPKIKQVAIVSVPDPRLGERGCAFVSLRENETIDLEEIKEYLQEKGFAKYKFPEYLVIKDELPTTPSGKISKGLVRAEAASLSEN